MSPDFYNGLLFFVSIFLITIAIVSILKQKSKKSNLYLGLFFLIFGFSALSRFLEVAQLIHKIPHLIEVDFPFCFLMNPFYLFFVKSFLYEYKPSRKELFLHSIPAVLVFMFLVPVFLFNTTEKIEYIANEASSSFSWRYRILNPLFFLQSVCYLFYILFTIKKNKMSEQVDSVNKVILLRVFTIFLLSIQFLTLIFILLINGEKKFEYIPILAVGVLLLILVWILQKSDFLNSNKTLSVEEIKIKYKNSALTNEDVITHAQNISKIINEKQLFLDKNISLSTLSENLQLTSRTISEVINRHFCCSFNDLINGLRVDYSKTLLLKNISVMKIDFIGQAAGFSSRASFYSNFKKLTGLSPSDFVKKHKSLN